MVPCLIRLQGEGITPNTRFLDHMMQASVDAKQWVTAEAIFRAMTEKYGHTNVVTRQSTLHFIQVCVRLSCWIPNVLAWVMDVSPFPFPHRVNTILCCNSSCCAPKVSAWVTDKLSVSVRISIFA